MKKKFYLPCLITRQVNWNSPITRRICQNMENCKSTVYSYPKAYRFMKKKELENLMLQSLWRVSLMRFFLLSFFHQTPPLGPTRDVLGPFQILANFRGVIQVFNCLPDVYDTGESRLCGVLSTGESRLQSVLHTGQSYFRKSKKLSGVLDTV